MPVGETLDDTAFSVKQTADLERTLTLAHEMTGSRFCIFVGPLPAGRDSALSLQRDLNDPSNSVLVAVDPEQRIIEIVTGLATQETLDNRACQLACMTMISRFSIGDIAAGVRDGVLVLAEHARRPPVLHTNQPG